jgi:formate-dependent nitrite reductase membrane component NrfD
MKIIGVIILVVSVWLLTSIRNLDIKASKKENIITSILFLIGVILLCIFLKLFGWLDKWFS